MKDLTLKILLFIFIANFFYDDIYPYVIKRIIYTVFVYLATYELFLFHYNTIMENRVIKMPSYYKTLVTLLFIFIIISLITDAMSPTLNYITLLNHPYALLAVVPIFVFFLGAHTTDIENVIKLLSVVGVIFLLTIIIPIPGNTDQHQGFVACASVLPLLALSISFKRKLLFPILLIFAALYFSQIAEFRIITLRILLFLPLFFSLNAIKRTGWFLKLLIILSASTFVFFVLTNLDLILGLFTDAAGNATFADDTRSFLYEEFFGDVNSSELILGRGFLGTYFSEYFLHSEDLNGDFYQRFGIEVGFLQLLLKGGFVYYLLYVISLWYVAIKGIFWYSHQKTTFIISIYLFTELLLMFFENVPNFSFHHSLMFFFAGYAYRQMTYKETDNDLTLQNVSTA